MKALYLQQFVIHSLELLRLGYDDVRSEISAVHLEEEVTELIVDAIHRRCETGQIPPYLMRFEASDDAKVTNPARHGKKRKRIDIRLVRVGIGRPTFEVEAKCLRTSSNPIGDYTGKAGLMLFVSEEYAMHKPVAGMLGYIKNRDATYWREQLQGKLKADAGELGLISGLDDTVDLAFPDAYTSRHKRHSGSELLIQHVLADCC